MFDNIEVGLVGVFVGVVWEFDRLNVFLLVYWLWFLCLKCDLCGIWGMFLCCVVDILFGMLIFFVGEFDCKVLLWWFICFLFGMELNFVVWGFLCYLLECLKLLKLLWWLLFIGGLLGDVCLFDFKCWFGFVLFFEF